MRRSKYGKGWKAIRRAALLRANHKCEIRDGTPWGRCTPSDIPRLQVHHLGPYALLEIWPALTILEICELEDYPYILGQEGRHKELEEFLRRNPELYPVLCPHHHALFEYRPRTLVRWMTKEGRALMGALGEGGA